MADQIASQETEQANSLPALIEKSGLDKSKAQVLLENFQDYFELAAEWEKKSKSLVVTKDDQLAEMKMAREGRLFLRQKRLAIENTRKELKEQSLREGKAIDGIANVLKAVIVPIEDFLDKQEHFIENREKEAAEARRVEAEKLLREKEEREAAERAAEEARVRAENERLKQEAAEREKEAAADRAEAERKIQEERRASEAKLQAERAEAERKAAAERARVEKEREAERKIAEQKAEAERALAQKKLEEEREAARVAQEKAVAEANAVQYQAEFVTCPKCGERFHP